MKHYVFFSNALVKTRNGSKLYLTEPEHKFTIYLIVNGRFTTSAVVVPMIVWSSSFLARTSKTSLNYAVKGLASKRPSWSASNFSIESKPSMIAASSIETSNLKIFFLASKAPKSQTSFTSSTLALPHTTKTRTPTNMFHTKTSRL
jgi:hypothetical protein